MGVMPDIHAFIIFVICSYHMYCFMQFYPRQQVLILARIFRAPGSGTLYNLD